MRDFLAAGKGDRDAMDRLHRNNAQVADFYTRAGVTTVAGAGGQFDPPLWAVADYVALPRAGRAFANTLNNQVLPGGVSSINLPTIATGTSVAAQASQNVAVSNTDPTTSSVSISISTIAGYNLISQQAIDQSPINMDQVILADLMRAYDGALDSASITAVAGTSGIIGQTYTDAAPTTAKVNNQILDAVQKVATQRFDSANVIVMHPKRWANFMGYLDTAGRPSWYPSVRVSVRRSTRPVPTSTTAHRASLVTCGASPSSSHPTFPSTLALEQIRTKSS
jgi:HK97 family phage major capsid protein